MQRSVLYFIYTFFYLISFIFLHVFYLILPKKIKTSIALKWQSIFSLIKAVDLGSDVILIHAASGEIEYAKPLIRKLKESGKNVVISYSSPSFLELISTDISDLKTFALPFDFPILTNWWLAKLNIRCIYYSRTDIWPWMAYCSNQLRIPQKLFSANFSQNIQKPSWPRNIYNKIILNHLTEIHVVADADAQYLKKIGLNSIFTSGDTRFDQVLYRKSFARILPTHLKKLLDKKNYICFGSTWPEDEVELIPLFTELIKTRKIILAPHEVEPQHIAHILSTIDQKLKVIKLSQVLEDSYFSEQNQNFDVLLVDRVGYLFSLYEFSQISFIGGSFKKNVHSVMEPLCWGNVVFVGPYFHNNREAIEFSVVPLEQIDSRLHTFRNNSKNDSQFAETLNIFSDKEKFLHNEEFSPLYVVMSIKESNEFFEFYIPLNNYLISHPETSKYLSEAISKKSGATEVLMNS